MSSDNSQVDEEGLEKARLFMANLILGQAHGKEATQEGEREYMVVQQAIYLLTIIAGT
jgi:hypothetical protein